MTLALEHPVNDGVIEVQEGHGLELVGHALPEDTGEAVLGDGAATEAGDDVPDRLTRAIKRQPHVGGDDTAHADGETLFDDQHPLGIPQQVAGGVQGEGAEGGDADDADRVAGLPQFIHRILDGAEDRTQGHDDGLRAFDPIGADQATGLAA